PLGISGAAFGDGLTRDASVWSVVGFDRYRRTFNVDLAGNWLSAASGPSAHAQAPQLWRTQQNSEGVRVQMAFADDIAPETHRLPVDRADLERTATRIEARLAR